MKHCSRRQLLKTTLFSTVLFSVPAPLLAATRPALTIPPLFEARRGKPIFLNMQNTQAPLLPGKRTDVWGFNGSYLGPTIKIKKDDFAKLNWKKLSLVRYKWWWAHMLYSKKKWNLLI